VSARSDSVRTDTRGGRATPRVWKRIALRKHSGRSPAALD
jgi:hypothetical protein